MACQGQELPLQEVPVRERLLHPCHAVETMLIIVAADGGATSMLRGGPWRCMLAVIERLLYASSAQDTLPRFLI